jgi:genome maintenance exonuclease 1
MTVARKDCLPRFDLSVKIFTHVPLAVALPELSADTTTNGRYYTTPEGNVYPSITTVLSVLSKDHIATWKDRVGEVTAKQISEHASNRGTELHAVLESYLKNEDLIFPADPKSKVRIMFNRMKRVLNNVDNVLAQEVPLYSDSLGIAGRCDVIAEWMKQLSIVDFKGSTKAKQVDWIQSYFMQATGYSLMFEERTGIKIDQIVILMSGEDDFSCQVFVEQRDKFIEPLKETIALFHKNL